MTRQKHTPAKAAAHPGRCVRLEIVEPLGLSVTEAAQALGVHRVALSRLLNEQAGLSPEMAIRLEKAFGADMERLMHMQTAYDIAEARFRADEIDVPPFSRRRRERGPKAA